MDRGAPDRRPVSEDVAEHTRLVAGAADLARPASRGPSSRRLLRSCPRHLLGCPHPLSLKLRNRSPAVTLLEKGLSLVPGPAGPACATSAFPPPQHPDGSCVWAAKAEGEVRGGGSTISGKNQRAPGIRDTQARLGVVNTGGAGVTW